MKYKFVISYESEVEADSFEQAKDKVAWELPDNLMDLVEITQANDNILRSEVHPKSQLDKHYCDYCGRQIGWVYNLDLNGNYFYCQMCFTKYAK